MVLLACQAAGCLLVVLAVRASAAFVGDRLVPWQATALPLALATVCVVTAIGVWRRARWSRVVAAVVQVIVVVAGVVGFIHSDLPLLFAAIALGLVGLVFVWFDRPLREPQ